MRKLQILGVALVAVFAVGVLTAASASAVVTFLLAEWLVNGAAVTEEQNVKAIGTILLEDNKATGGASDVECSGILDGWIGPDGLDRISDVLTLDGLTTISLTPLVEPGLACTKLSGLCEEPLVWPLKLPWDTLMELMEEGTEKWWVILIEGKPGWYVICMKTLFEPTDECVAPSVAEKENAIIHLELEAGVLLLGNFSESFTTLAGELLGTCTQGGAESGIVETVPSEIVLEAGGTLSASSDNEEV